MQSPSSRSFSSHKLLFSQPQTQNSYVPSETARDSLSRTHPHILTKLPPLSTLETARLACLFWFFWFVANWTSTASLDYTSVASTTILSATSGLFTLVIGRLFRIEPMTLAKLCAVVTRYILNSSCRTQLYEACNRLHHIPIP